MRLPILPAVTFAVGLAVGMVLSGASTRGTPRRPVGSEILVDVPHPDAPWKRIRTPLAIHRVNYPDGTFDAICVPPDGPEWVVVANGVGYRGSPRPSGE